MADKARSRGVGSRNLPPEIKSKWQKIGKYCQTRFNTIQKEQGLDAGIDYINSMYDTKYPSGANAPKDTLHHVDSSAITPPEATHHSATASNAPEGKKKITALLSEDLHRRLSIHSAVTGNSINQIIAQLIRDHVADYQVTIK